VTADYAIVDILMTKNLSIAMTTSANSFLWSPYVIGQTIIFLPCDFYLLLFLFLA